MTLDCLYAFLAAFQGVGCVHVHVWCESVLDRLLGPFTAVLRVGGVWVCAGRAQDGEGTNREFRRVKARTSKELGALEIAKGARARTVKDVSSLSAWGLRA